MSKIDMSKMVKAAGDHEHTGWVLRSHTHGAIKRRYILSNGGQVLARIETDSVADFIANAPAAILALYQRIQELEAQVCNESNP